MPLSTKTFLIFSNLNSRISYLSFMHRKDCKYPELTRGGKEAKPDMNSQFIQGIQFE